MWPENLISWAPGITGASGRISDFFSVIPGSVWAMLYAFWLTASVSYLLMQRRPPTATLAWIIGFLSLPVLGAVVYFFFGPRKLRRRKRRRSLARRLARETIPITGGNLPDRFKEQTNFADLARVVLSRTDAGPSQSGFVQLYDNGDDTYAAIESAMRSSRLHIHIEYYIFEADAIGYRWLEVLTEQARRGVKVRVLIDGLGSKNCPIKWWEPLTSAGGEVRVFNPVRIFKPKPGRLNFRTHRKIVVIDGNIGFTGGINICAENSTEQCGINAWRDTHMQVVGRPVVGLQTLFFEDWMFAAERDTTWIIVDRDLADTPDDINDWFPKSTQTQADRGPWVQIIDSGPDEPSADIHRFFFTAITQAKHRVWITTPYFVPDEPMLVALSTATARGVDVQLLIPYEGDSRLVTAAASTYASQVAAEGTSVWTYGPGMNHAKTMVVDNELSIVGTANMDNRSFRLNFEVVAAIYDPAVNQELAGMFTSDLTHAKRLIPGQNEGSFIQRLIASGARLFAPLL